MVFSNRLMFMSWNSEERRQFVRVEYPCKVTISGPVEQTIYAKTENISAGGIRFIIKERLLVSSVVDLKLHIPNKETIICKGRVIWVFGRKGPFFKGRQFFDTGIEFSTIDNKDVNTIKELVVSIALSKKESL